MNGTKEEVWAPTYEIHLKFLDENFLREQNAQVFRRYHVENKPQSWIDLDGLETAGLGEIKCVTRRVGFSDAWKGHDISNEAFNKTRELFPEQNDIGTGEANAFLHCYWSCEMTKQINSQVAKDITDCHEDYSTDPDPGESNKDLYNNSIGREIGLRKELDCKDACMAATDPDPSKRPCGLPPLKVVP